MRKVRCLVDPALPGRGLGEPEVLDGVGAVGEVPRSMPASSTAWTSSRPAGPTKGLPCWSSMSPGCSPTSTIRAFLGPAENTVWVAAPTARSLGSPPRRGAARRGWWCPGRSRRPSSRSRSRPDGDEKARAGHVRQNARRERPHRHHRDVPPHDLRAGGGGRRPAARPHRRAAGAVRPDGVADGGPDGARRPAHRSRATATSSSARTAGSLATRVMRKHRLAECLLVAGHRTRRGSWCTRRPAAGSTSCPRPSSAGCWTSSATRPCRRTATRSRAWTSWARSDGDPLGDSEGLVTLDRVEVGGGGPVVVRRLAEPLQSDTALMSRLRRAGVRPGASITVGPSSRRSARRLRRRDHRDQRRGRLARLRHRALRRRRRVRA